MDEFGFATREQLQLACDLSGDRNAMRILAEMESEKLIGSYREERKVYFVTNRGYNRIGSTKQPTKGRASTHTLMRNDAFMLLGMPKNWRKEAPLKYSGGEIVCDAFYKDGGEYVFVEVDCEQKMANNYEKLQRYKQLASEMKPQFNHTPSVVYYTTTELKRRKLAQYMKELGVKGQVYAAVTEAQTVP